MMKRTLGERLEVSAIGLGCMGMNFGYGPAPDRKEMIALIRAAVARAVTFFDTAEVYGPFTNEALVGEALAPMRGDVAIAAKFVWNIEELAIGFVPFSPLGKGFLTGQIDEKTTFSESDFRNTVPRFSPENRKANLTLVERVRDIANRKKAAPAQIALAWVLAQKPWIVPIPGTTKPSRLEENLGAANVSLMTEDLRELNDLSGAIHVQGERYSATSQRWIDR